MPLPEWVIAILKGMGVEGGIIFVLLTLLFMSLGGNAKQYLHANKVYGYRLTERDTLNKALTEATQVIAEMLKDAEERNELTDELADLLNKQAVALEQLRISVNHATETAKENHASAMDTARVSAQAVTAMAESLRVLHTMVGENRVRVAEQVATVKDSLAAARDEILRGIRDNHDTLARELRQLIGNDGTVVVRRRQVQNTRPTKKA